MSKDIIITLLASLLTSFGYSQDLSTERSHIDYQIGKWEDNKQQSTADNRKYKFGYEVNWFDRNKTIIKIRVTGIFEDGEIRTFWEGFKHWSTTEKKLLYNGYSPDGRIVSGYLEINDKEITTHYTSDSPKGKIYVKDIATKIDQDNFKTKTYLKMEGQEWKLVNEDNWSRVM